MHDLKPISALAILALTLTPGLANDRACPFDKFSDFAEAFQNSPERQPSMSTDPLMVTRFQAMGSSMPARHTSPEAQADMEWPILPTIAELEVQGFYFYREQIDAHTAELYTIPTSSRPTNMTWHFEKTPCWTLTGVTDGTLEY
jgi:hypothetical protein